jgi:hypothetical protein
LKYAHFIGWYQTIFFLTIDMIFGAPGASPSIEKTSANEISIGGSFYFASKDHRGVDEVTSDQPAPTQNSAEKNLW